MNELTCKNEKEKTFSSLERKCRVSGPPTIFGKQRWFTILAIQFSADAVVNLSFLVQHAAFRVDHFAPVHRDRKFN